MRLIYLGSFRLPNGDAAAARVLNIARALRLAGHEVSFISWGGTQRSEDFGEDNITRVDGFPYIVTNEIDFEGGFFKKAYRWLTHGNKTRKMLREKLGDYDAVISYNCSLINWLIPFCQKHNILLISDLTEWYSYSEMRLVERPGYFYNMHLSQNRIKNKIVISSYLDYCFRTSHNIVVPATCDSSEVKWHIGVDKINSNIKPFEGITLIYAGTPARKDAVHYAIGAVNRLILEGANIRLLILGTTRENYLNNYGNLLPNISLSDDIRFLGRVPQDEVPSYYALADFMVLLREQTRKSNAGFPTKFSESITSGTPVIANITSDLSNYLIDGKTGFIVDSPTEEAIFYTLKEKVLPLTKDEIIELKSNVRSISKKLDYHNYVEPLKSFMDKLS